MLIQNIKLNQFRNHDYLDLDFDKGMNIIVGSNGAGKTNILESIILISNTKSFRTTEEKKMIKHLSTYSTVEISTNENYLKVVLNEKGKSFYIDNELIRKTSNMIGKLNAIIFKPGDIELYTQSPKARRKEIDLELGKISSTYLKSIVNYNHYLKQKNTLLKERTVDENLLSIINETLAPVIKVIIQEREKFINNINQHINNIYKEISGDNASIKVTYKKCCDIDDIETNIELAKEKDKLFQHSTFGPHREDYIFTINGEELNNYASQGQKRMIIISLKLAIVKYIKEQLNKDIVVLLDDVLSELDVERSTRLLNMLPNNQTIMTATHINELKISKTYKLIELEEKKNG